MPDATKADLYTYSATLLRVIDGDTIVVMLELAPEVWVEQKLRLRDLDCPEMKTPEGKVAKRFTEAALADATSKPDKYDRYLADVFLGEDVAGLVEPGPGSATPATARSDDLFLNNALLENGHAVHKTAWEFGDWEPELVK